MAEHTNIGWTDATWNPVTGCTEVSPGCDNCYARAITERWGRDFSKVVVHPERLEQPFHWRKPRMIFTCSMSDLLHPRVPFDYIAQVFTVMAQCPQHTFQVLTKRPGRMAHFAQCYPWPSNVWAGTSMEMAKYLPRLDVLARIPAEVRFVSLEPLLGPVDLRRWLLPMDEHKRPGLAPVIATVTGGSYRMLDWVIIGGESGPHRRKMRIEWVEAVAEQCAATGVPLFVKQASGPRPGMQGDIPDWLWGRKEIPDANLVSRPR